MRSDFDREYFDRTYRNYRAQNPARKLDYYHRCIERLGLKDGSSLLDVGCGLGAFLEHLQRRQPSWVLSGADISEYAIDENRQRLPGIDFRRGGAEETPFEARSMDVITAFDVIEHVQDRDRVAEAMRTMLRPAGHMLMVVPVYDGPAGPVIHILDRDPTHVHKLSRRDWLSWAGSHFRVLWWEGIFRFLLPGGPYLHLPTVRFRQLSPAILIAAQVY